VIPSFGGWSADQGGTEIADSCKDVNAIAAAYESVITTYDVTRLDMDVEGRSLTRTDGIARRNKALKLVENWAAAHKRPLQISYTLPTTPSGLESTGVAILQNAIANGTRVDVVNIMTFDYYDGVTTDMGAAAIGAAQSLFDQLRTLYPAKSESDLWGMEGNTILPGIDDYPRKPEVTYPADAQRLYDSATAKGIDTLSIWAIQRDNGGRPGSTRGRGSAETRASSHDATLARNADRPARAGLTATARPRLPKHSKSAESPSSHDHESRERRACVTIATWSRGTASPIGIPAFA